MLVIRFDLNSSNLAIIEIAISPGFLDDIDFNPIVTKYADNGRVFTEDQYKKYRATYRERSEGEWLREYFEHLTSQIFRKYVHYESRLYNYGRNVFNTYKKILSLCQRHQGR